MAHFPVNLDITDRLCVVVGGGKVALRKVYSLLESNARVRVISPVVLPQLEELAERGVIECVVRGYRQGDLAGAFLVFAATDLPLIQDAVAREAAESNVLLNSADDPLRCNFQVPAKIRRGSLLLTVSTGGASPALSRRIRIALEQQFGKEYAMVTTLFALVREQVVTGYRNSAHNKQLFEELLQAGIVEMILENRWEHVLNVLRKLLPPEVEATAIVERTRTEHPFERHGL